MFLIEKHEAVHLAGESHAMNLASGNAGFGEHAADGLASRVPPVLGALLGPQRALHPHVFVHGRITGADDPARVHQEGPRPTRSDIDPQPHTVL